LQARLAAHPDVLGLDPDRLWRELPCVRPRGQRAFIDLAGVDAAGRIHLVETKIGDDPMLVLQGLDYWIWADAHRAELAEHLHVKPDTSIQIEASLLAN
jgi:hypothetical protein